MATYFGPHVCCKISKIQSSIKINTCSCETCKEYPNKIWTNEKKFCSMCGSPIQIRDVSVEIDNVNASRLQEDIHEALCIFPGDDFHDWMRDNNIHIWIANRRNPNSRNFNLSCRMPPTMVKPELIAVDLEEFGKFYSKELEVLRKEYGGKNVEIQYGLMNY